jgi:hypothetical protein
MLDRQKIESVLIRRFPGATPTQVAAATNAIMGLEEDEWEEVPDGNPELGARFPADCRRGCAAPGEHKLGGEFRYFRRRQPQG